MMANVTLRNARPLLSGNGLSREHLVQEATQDCMCCTLWEDTSVMQEGKSRCIVGVIGAILSHLKPHLHDHTAWRAVHSSVVHMHMRIDC